MTCSKYIYDLIHIGWHDFIEAFRMKKFLRTIPVEEIANAAKYTTFFTAFVSAVLEYASCQTTYWK